MKQCSGAYLVVLNLTFITSFAGKLHKCLVKTSNTFPNIYSQIMYKKNIIEEEL